MRYPDKEQSSGNDNADTIVLTSLGFVDRRPCDGGKIGARLEKLRPLRIWRTPKVTRDGDALAIAEAKTCHRALERSNPVAPGFVRIRAGRSNLSDQPQRHTPEPATINPVLFGQTPDIGLFVELVHQIQQRLLGQAF